MKPKRTNKELLGKGIQRIVISFILIFISPVIIHSAFQNKEQPLYIPILAIGFIGAGLAIYMGFKAIKTIMDAFFGKKNPKNK